MLQSVHRKTYSSPLPPQTFFNCAGLPSVLHTMLLNASSSLSSLRLRPFLQKLKAWLEGSAGGEEDLGTACTTHEFVEKVMGECFIAGAAIVAAETDMD